MLEADINVVIVAAGRGQRFAPTSAMTPKPLITARGRPIMFWAIEGLALNGRHMFVIRREAAQAGLTHAIREIKPSCTFVLLDATTEGSACSALTAIESMPRNTPVLISNCDQYIDYDKAAFLAAIDKSGVDGAVLTFTSIEPRWSFAAVHAGRVMQVVAKRAVSDVALVGVYYWRRAGDFVRSARAMIAANARVENEFFVCPVYNGAIAAGANVIAFPVRTMTPLGTPEDIVAFELAGAT